jgi:hypothetical protein
VTNNLRDRIARALYEDWWHVSESWHEPPRWEKLSDAARDGWLLKGDAVIAALNLGQACEGGCVWQIPNRFQDMTQAQKELLKRKEASRQWGCGDDRCKACY